MTGIALSGSDCPAHILELSAEPAKAANAHLSEAELTELLARVAVGR